MNILVLEQVDLLEQEREREKQVRLLGLGERDSGGSSDIHVVVLYVW